MAQKKISAPKGTKITIQHPSGNARVLMFENPGSIILVSGPTKVASKKKELQKSKKSDDTTIYWVIGAVILVVMYLMGFIKF